MRRINPTKKEAKAMTSPNDVPPPADETGIATEQLKNSRPRPNRLNQALAWVGIVVGGLAIVAAIFFSGFFLSWSIGGHEHEHMRPDKMACCTDMKPGEQMMKPDEHMKPGAMMPPGNHMTPGEMMPGGMMGPGTHSPATTAPSTPRP
jgi:hypothetical protein